MSRYGSRELISYIDFSAYEDARREEAGMNPTDFTMRYSKAARRTPLCFALICLAFALSPHILYSFPSLRPLPFLFYPITAFFGITFLYRLSYRCHVTSQRIVQTAFGVLKKEADWASIKAKKGKKDKQMSLSAYRTNELLLYRDNRKKAFHFFDSMVGFTYLQKMIKKKNIPTLKKH